MFDEISLLVENILPALDVIPIMESVLAKFIAFYVIVLMIILYGLIFTQKKTAFWGHLALYCCYAGYLTYLFIDGESLKYGGALPVYFYGYAMPILHFLGYLLFKAIRSLSRFIAQKKRVEKEN